MSPGSWNTLPAAESANTGSFSVPCFGETTCKVHVPAARSPACGQDREPLCPRQCPRTAAALGMGDGAPLASPAWRPHSGSRTTSGDLAWVAAGGQKRPTWLLSSHRVTVWPPTASELPADPGGRSLTVETPFLHVTGGEARFSPTQSKPLVCVLCGLGSA